MSDLPTPEEVWGVGKIGFKETVKFAVGPSLIALGVSIGSGEWVLGPLAIGAAGEFKGLFFVVLLSLLFQVFFNVESARYVVATGETPVLGFARVPPGWKFWAPASIILFYFAFILGGWAAGAGQSLLTIFEGEVVESTDERARLLAIGLLVVIFAITALSKKISRGLELANWVIVSIIIGTLIVLNLFVVEFSLWGDALAGFFTPALPPEGTDVTLLGALWGFTAMAAGLNWFIMTHYRDKGYGMGHRVGYLSGIRGTQQDVLEVLDGLRDTVLEDLDFLAADVMHRHAVLHRIHVDAHVVRAGAECRLRFSRGLTALRDQASGSGQNTDTNSQSSMHGASTHGRWRKQSISKADLKVGLYDQWRRGARHRPTVPAT
jgi:hypothetical protein